MLMDVHSIASTMLGLIAVPAEVVITLTWTTEHVYQVQAHACVPCQVQAHAGSSHIGCNGQ